MSKTTLKGATNRTTLAGVSIAAPSSIVTQIGEVGGEAVCTSNQQPVNSNDEAIRMLAHSKWEAAGCPAGDGVDFWLEAEREVKVERIGSSPA